MCPEFECTWVVINIFRLQMFVVVACVPLSVGVGVVYHAEIVCSWTDEIEVCFTVVCLFVSDDFVGTVNELHYGVRVVALKGHEECAVGV